MSEFFKFVIRYFQSWRRMIGVVMLVVALLLAGCWIRSFRVRTEIAFGRSERNVKSKYKTYYHIPTEGWFSTKIETKVFQQLISRNGIIWRKLEVTNPDTLVVYPTGWRDTDYDAFKSFTSADGFAWRRSLFGFEFGECHKGTENVSIMGGDASSLALSDPRLKLSFWLIPYWSIVIPLTLFSACLLLSKPRKSSQEQRDQRAKSYSTADTPVK